MSNCVSADQCQAVPNCPRWVSLIGGVVSVGFLEKVPFAPLTFGFKDACETAAEGTREYGVRLIEAGRTNLNAAFDYAAELLSAKSPSEAIELSTAQLRKQFETLAEQSKELASLAQKIATESTEPIREGVNKAFKQAA